MEDCVVCCSSLGEKKITCSLCNFVTCRKCAMKYLLEVAANPMCMNCNKPWSRAHMVEQFGMYFLSYKYKKRREEILFDLEKALLPETIPYALQVKKVTEINKKIDDVEKKITEVSKEMFKMTYEGRSEEDMKQYLEERKNIRMTYYNLREDASNLHLLKDFVRGKNVVVRKESNYLVKCPKDECRGYVGQKMTCELCETKLCKQCHVILTEDEEHTCSEQDIETVKILFANTKNCPGCKSLIYKIDGCDQMYCTMCHTAFSWRTGEVVTGKIHNPHYYEYLRQTGNIHREIGDIPCGGLPDLRAIFTKFGTNSAYIDVHRICTHVQYDELERYSVNNVTDNRDLRILYLNNTIPESQFKTELHRREKSMNKRREIGTILNTFLVVCSDIFRRIMNGTENEVETLVLNEFESIRRYTNNLLMDVSKVYGCVVPVIDSSWDQIKRERYTSRNGEVS